MKKHPILAALLLVGAMLLPFRGGVPSLAQTFQGLVGVVKGCPQGDVPSYDASGLPSVCSATGSGSAFSAITTGTNTSATMTVGTGATITASGSGVVNATECNGGSCGGTTGGNGFFAFTFPVLTDFTWVNQGSATATQNANTIYATYPAGSGDNLRALVEAAPGSTPYSITMWYSTGIPIPGNYQQKGLAFYDSVSGKLLTFSFQTNSNSCAGGPSNFALSVDEWTNTTTHSASPMASCFFQPEWLGLRITVSAVGGTDTYYYSTDGVNWTDYYSATDGAFLTQNEVGFYGNTNNSSNSFDLTLASWTN